ncbi:MAG: YdcF family protein [Muribaculaceae bacterium]|nr:YdcF family protein [Muribaculaceae bacterium]
MKKLHKKILLSLAAMPVLLSVFTLAVNLKVESASGGKIYTHVDSIPHNRVALLLGTNPLNRYGRPNTYFTTRIAIASELYHAGKIDYILASGDNHTKSYDEPTAMRDSLVARGVPQNRIILDFAGFRTLDSIVRAKEVFGCDTLTIISQADHCSRALYLADAAGINAQAIAAPVRAGRRVRTRLALREWLARDKMMLDLWFGKQPHFLGEKIRIDAFTQEGNSGA